MARKVSAEPGALLKIAGPRGLTSLTAISKSTGSDRKTLKAINDGQPVKESTLEALANKMSVPHTHLITADAQGVEQEPAFASPKLREVSMEPLNAKRLREMLEKKSQPNAITWALNLNDITNEAEAMLLEFEARVKEWMLLLNGWDHWENKNRDLAGQLEKIKMATEIESRIKQLLDENLKLFGANFLCWTMQDFKNAESFFPFTRLYNSESKVVIAIEPKSATSSKVALYQGEQPPRSFENMPSRISEVLVNYESAWRRTEPSSVDDDEIPF
jgi:hypothetical protein